MLDINFMLVLLNQFQKQKQIEIPVYCTTQRAKLDGGTELVGINTVEPQNELIIVFFKCR